MRIQMMTLPAAGLFLLCSACSAAGTPDTTNASEPQQADPSGWHCEEVFHNKFQNPYRIPEEQEASSRAALEIYSSLPLTLTDDWTIQGWFDQDVTIGIEQASECSEGARGKTTYADAVYGDTWYFDISEPEKYVHGLPESLMPDAIRVSYLPKGSIIVNERECILISFGYLNEARDAHSDSMIFTYFNGPDTTDGWNWGT